MKRISLLFLLALVAMMNVYSQKYIWVLDRLKVGMTKNQVLWEVGEPNLQKYDKKTKTRYIYYNMLEHKGGWGEPTVSCVVILINDSVVKWGRYYEGNFISLNPDTIQTTKEKENPVERLSTIKSMLDNGLITEDEYNAKKKEILDNL